MVSVNISVHSSQQLKREISNPVANQDEAEVSSGGQQDMDTSSIDELKRAFEFIEVSSPGITDQLLRRISAYLQHR